MELFSTPEEFLHDDVEEPGEALPETVVLAAFRDDLARLAEKILLKFSFLLDSAHPKHF